MLRSMYSGISGMKNFQTKLDVIGNNIANVNTYGFKKGRVTFKDTMNQTISGASAATQNKGGKNPMQVGLGSTIASIDLIDTQSSLQTTGRALDLAISGDGYFVVKQGQSQMYTRAGNFYLDDNGTLVTGDGLKVQSLNNGILEDITVNVNALLPAKQTTELVMKGNLPEDAKGASELLQQLKVVDGNGIEHVIDMTIKPDGANGAATGNWTVSFVDKSIPVADPTQPNPNITTVNIQIPTNTAQNITLNLNNGSGTAVPFTVALPLGGLTVDGGSMDANAYPDGNTQGALESFNIGSTGEINGVFSNGLVLTLGQLALAKFSNPSGLSKVGNNTFQESVNSGTANINVPGEGRGSIAAGALEMSNVDLSEEFTEMITAQRGFQANTRIITTSDEILQELVNLKR
ncbi:flagellar hook-basal body complex protein [Mesobacillus sp. AQ2]|uniref:flagellar hook protein FlgE n=1 Tax=Bacillaceae TaxID=186817 RepID=UPI0011A2B023|nr:MULTISPECIES: flagellar hook-basal body complex protein [Bacillaceae]MCM3123306.1 flagellar hook-basal body complex protein [Mesobacillus sp. MER 33]MCM3233211.1 flagellar hook-basal body complex protein [Mesobacillus sp. MER 48]WHX42276.1 flagellar hook-basal body complex protein [Mesobacillus sp. AQ2]